MLAGLFFFSAVVCYVAFIAALICSKPFTWPLLGIALAAACTVIYLAIRLDKGEV